ncbi:undecaprenyl diphosphate synthase family protein [Desulfitibacter alkalitolerans]|uniref:undecaprenyl diphosphate synthase family protein n=1 Tax=Desulfitibacter alkalitolerans TaxID=264641 RepID=UPI000481053A|nr:undecaprenyl diphosphate synthase family protein [Desulfitibacter alkalitolerans]
MNFKRVPNHIGVIPDGNRRWAEARGMSREMGYEKGIEPGFELYKICLDLGVKEMTFYGFTQDNTKRPAVQTKAFQKACVDAVKILSDKDASLLVVGNTDSPLFPSELLPFTKRTNFGSGKMKVNFLVNYSWWWDINRAYSMGTAPGNPRDHFPANIASGDISRIDLVIRWGGRRRLSGFLPVQTIYADFYIIDEFWPDYKPEHLYDALRWYETQDITLGG